jgi:hypothetical protein
MTRMGKLECLDFQPSLTLASQAEFLSVVKYYKAFLWK